MELLSEINNTGTVNGIAPWSRDNDDEVGMAQYRSAVASWQLEVAEYIKEELDHTEHLLASSYLTGGALDSYGDHVTELSLALPDNTYVSNPYLDVICESRYVSSLVDFAKIAKTNSWRYHGDLDDLLPPAIAGFGIEKPIIYSELGFPETSDDGENFSDCISTNSNIKYLMLYPFSGIANAGNSWYDFRNPDRTHWEVFDHVRSFMENIDLHEHNWVAEGSWTQHPNSDLVKIAMSFVRTGASTSGDLRVAGAIYNLSWNEYNFKECQVYDCLEEDIGVEGCDCDQLDEPHHDGFHLHDLNVTGSSYDITSSSSVGGSDALVLDHMGSSKTYFVRYYNPLVGDYCFSSSDGIEHFEVQSNPFGNLALTIPFTLSEDFPVVYFELWDDDLSNFRRMQHSPEQNSSALASSASTQVTDVLNDSIGIKVFPNPVLDNLNLEINDVDVPLSFSIVTLANSAVYKGLLTSSLTKLDLSSLASGTYILIVSNGDEVHHQRIVKL